MQFLALIYNTEGSDDVDFPTLMEQYNAFGQSASDAGVTLGGNALQPVSTATSVRVRNDKSNITDGPFAETKEQLGGYYLLECKDLDEALSWAARIPTARCGTIEVRPCCGFRLMHQPASDLARVFRAESGRILAALMMHARSIDLAEDSLQDALLQATEQWPKSGMPDNKAAWLLTVARRRLIDRIRKDSHRNADMTIQTIRDLLPHQADAIEIDENIPDERLRLIFTCCHPALAQDARVPLTLKTLCGLSAREIARAFLTSEVTMNQRLTRAKRKIRDAGIAYEVPKGTALTERLPSVLSVIYLIYNESYNAFEGQTLTRSDLADESVHLARVLHQLLPRPEVAGLLALILLHDSRRNARSSNTQSFIPLEHQDRSLWNQELIREGTNLVLTAMSEAKPGPYQLQAAISALHATAPNWGKTDWLQVQQLYAVLYKLNPSPVVALNQAMAQAYAGDVKTAYSRLAELEVELKSYQPFFAARAELASQLGENEFALRDYEVALSLTRNEAEKEFLSAKKAAERLRKFI